MTDLDFIPEARGFSQRDKEFCEAVAQAMFYTWSGACTVLGDKDTVNQGEGRDQVILKLLNIYIFG